MSRVYSLVMGPYETGFAAALERYAVKVARHAVDRLYQRTKLPAHVVDQVEREVNDVKNLPRVPGYVTLRDQAGVLAGYAALKPAGSKMVVATILGPSMTPKGLPFDRFVQSARVSADKSKKKQ